MLGSNLSVVFLFFWFKNVRFFVKGFSVEYSNEIDFGFVLFFILKEIFFFIFLIVGMLFFLILIVWYSFVIIGRIFWIVGVVLEYIIVVFFLNGFRMWIRFFIIVCLLKVKI